MPSKTSDKKLDEIYDAVDALMQAGCWGFLNEFLENLIVRAWRTDIDELLAYGIATLPGKSKIPSREAFVSHCKRLFPEKDLWKGLD